MNIIPWELKSIIEAVSKLKRRLVGKIIKPKREIFVIVEGGVVHEIINLPPNINVTVIDCDTEGVENERLEISPVDGELCCINKW